MDFFLVPQRIKIDVVFSVDPALLAVLTRLADAADDRKAAADLSQKVEASTAALADALPKP